MATAGTLIDEKYEIVAQIGVGGFGSVYKAVQKSMARTVAIKMLRSSMLEETDGLPRFEREAKALNGLNHKNVVAFYGYGIWQKSPYMVMEYLHATSLQTIITTRGKLPAAEALPIMRQVFEGLAAAHAAGIIHRDLKPANIMVLDTVQTVKIIDFGLAKLMPLSGLEAQRLTETGCTLGTSHYMSPEQCLGGAVDNRADIYSAGCIFFEALTGRYPFDANESIAVMYQQVNLSAPRLSAFITDSPLTQALQIIIDNCLEKEPADRYSNCEEVLADVEAAAGGKYKLIKPRTIRQTKHKRFKIHTALIASLLLAAISIPLFLYLMLQSHSGAPNTVSSIDLYYELMRHVRNSRGYVEDKVPEFEEVLEANEKDHRLEPQQEYRLRIMVSRPLLLNNKERSKHHVNAALRLHAHIRPAQRSAPDEYSFASVLADFGMTEEAKGIFREMIDNQDHYSRDGWDVVQARMRLEEMDALDGNAARAEQSILTFLKTHDVGSELTAQVYTALANIYLLDHKYKPARKYALKAAETPQRFPVLPYFIATRAAAYNENWQEAEKYADLADRQRKREGEKRPCRSLTLLHIAAAAHNGLHDHALNILEEFNQETAEFPNASTIALGDDVNALDEKLCADALQAAHYSDIRQKVPRILLH